MPSACWYCKTSRIPTRTVVSRQKTFPHGWDENTGQWPHRDGDADSVVVTLETTRCAYHWCNARSSFGLRSLTYAHRSNGSEPECIPTSRKWTTYKIILRTWFLRQRAQKNVCVLLGHHREIIVRMKKNFVFIIFPCTRCEVWVLSRKMNQSWITSSKRVFFFASGSMSVLEANSFSMSDTRSATIISSPLHQMDSYQKM